MSRKTNQNVCERETLENGLKHVGILHPEKNSRPPKSYSLFFPGSELWPSDGVKSAFLSETKPPECWGEIAMICAPVLRAPFPGIMMTCTTQSWMPVHLQDCTGDHMSLGSSTAIWQRDFTPAIISDVSDDMALENFYRTDRDKSNKKKKKQFYKKIKLC